MLPLAGRAPRGGPLLATALVAVAAPAHAQLGGQLSGSVDAGGAVATYDDFDRSSVFSVTPAVRYESGRAVASARASFSRFESGNRSMQAGVGGSLVSPAVWNVRGEIAGSTSITRYARQLAATSVYGVGRLHVADATGGAWVGTGFGFVSRGTRLPENVLQLDLGAWHRVGSTTYTVTILPTRVGALRYADAAAGVRWQGARAELALGTGFRARGSQPVPGVKAWGEAWGTFWLNGRLAVVGGSGLFPFDVVQGVPGGRYAAAGVRIASRRPASDDPAARAELTVPYELRHLRRESSRAAGFQVADNEDGTRTVRVRVRGATRVELMADFTDWSPIPLGRGAADEWVTRLVIAPGIHRVNVRVDDGAWDVPSGLTAVRDEFGSSVGLLIVR